MFGNPKVTKLEAPAPDAAFAITIPAEMTQGMTYGGAVAPRISRREALQVPAVLRARNLIAGTLGGLPVVVRDPEREVVKGTNYIVADGYQIDPQVPDVVTKAYTYEDLLFEGLAWWRVLEFGFHGYPVHAEHIGVDRVGVVGWSPPVNGSGPVPGGITIDGYPVPDNQVIRFDSPNPPLLVHAARAIRTCLILDATAANYANEPQSLGLLQPEGRHPSGGEPRYGRRPARQVGQRPAPAPVRATSARRGSFSQLQFNAEQIQLADQRQHAVLEIARATGLDPEDLGVSTTSRTYQNSEQRRQDLIDFTLMDYAKALEQRLSHAGRDPTRLRIQGQLRLVPPRGHEGPHGDLRDRRTARPVPAGAPGRVGGHPAREPTQAAAGRGGAGRAERPRP